VEYGVVRAPPITITLANIDSAMFFTWIMKLLIEEQIGYDVAVYDQYTSVAERYEALVSHELDIKTEEWRLSHEPIYREFVQQKQVIEDAGNLGFVGRFGLDVASYLLFSPLCLSSIFPSLLFVLFRSFLSKLVLLQFAHSCRMLTTIMSCMVFFSCGLWA
jgi:hypothetical protein